jgi:hypothetical protein
MTIKIDTSSLRETKWYEYVIRFVFGGLITVIAGLIAKHSGPIIGGLFLAFPSIFPASLSLAAKHERQRKEAEGEDGTGAGKRAASQEAAGTSLGSIGLLAFAAVIWRMLPHQESWIVLLVASLGWMITSVLAWFIEGQIGEGR